LAVELSDTLRETTEATRTGGPGTIGREQMMNFGFNSLLSVLILAGDIWAIINIFQSPVSNEKKLLWILVVVLLPLLGLILWYFLGPRNRRA
jgi:hypothetical protein